METIFNQSTSDSRQDRDSFFASEAVLHKNEVSTPVAPYTAATKQSDNSLTSASTGGVAHQNKKNAIMPRNGSSGASLIPIKGHNRQRPKQSDQDCLPKNSKFDGDTIHALIQEMLQHQLEHEGIDDVVLDYLGRITSEFLDDCQAGLKAINAPDDLEELLDMFVGCVPGLTLEAKRLDGFLQAALEVHTRSYPCPHIPAPFPDFFFHDILQTRLSF
jgi:hypothetical protein